MMKMTSRTYQVTHFFLSIFFFKSGNEIPSQVILFYNGEADQFQIHFQVSHVFGEVSCVAITIQYVFYCNKMCTEC